MEEFVPQIATQAEDGEESAPFRFLALIQEADKTNANRRLFPQAVLEQVASSCQNDVQNRRFLGELGAPAEAKINFDKVSHIIIDLYLSSNNLMAEIEVLDTPPGRNLRRLLEMGAPIGFRMSGLGDTTHKDGVAVVNNDYKLIQIFACDNPA